MGTGPAVGSTQPLEEWNDEELDQAFALSLGELLADREYSKGLSEKEAEDLELALALSASAVGQETVADCFHNSPEEDSDVPEEESELALALVASLVDQGADLDSAGMELSAKRKRL